MVFKIFKTFSNLRGLFKERRKANSWFRNEMYGSLVYQHPELFSSLEGKQLYNLGGYQEFRPIRKAEQF